MSTILDEIVATKREEIAARKAVRPLDELRAAVDDAPPPRNFLQALTRQTGERIRLIAEVKKASPSQGLLRADFDPVEIAQVYERHGAACISVLTDEPYFQGSLEYLRDVRAAVQIPVLRKDFILDAYQLYEAREAGADAVLLIAECLDDCGLRSLHNEAIDLGMTPLVELYEPSNLDRVLQCGADLIGVNNRDLRTFQVDLHHCLRLREQVPGDRLMVGESGVERCEDVWLLEEGGMDAILVGGGLMAQADLGAAVDRLMVPKPQ